MSHVKEHESQDQITMEQIMMMLAWGLKYHQRNKSSVQKHKHLSFLAHFEIPKEVGSKMSLRLAKHHIIFSSNLLGELQMFLLLLTTPGGPC